MDGAALQTLRPNLPVLTSLRFFAAVIVVVFHFNSDRSVVPWKIFDLGYEAVAFFFILSGFILTYAHVDDAGKLNISATDFFVARAARILPAYYLALLLSAPFFLNAFFVSHAMPLHHFLSGSFAVPMLLQAWFPLTALMWNLPAWSLSVEAFFYALFPWIVGVASQRSPMRMLAFAYVGVIATACIIYIFTDYYRALDQEDASAQWLHILFFYSPPFHLAQFVLGVALGLCFIRYENVFKSAFIAEALLLSGLAMLILVVQYKSEGRWVLSPPIISIVFSAIILGGASGTGKISKLLSMPTLVTLGEASYALYIIHYPILIWWKWLLKRMSSVAIPPIAEFFVYVSFAIVCSVLVLLFLEKPARRWLIRRSNELRARYVAVQ